MSSKPKPERGGFELEVKQEESAIWSTAKVEQLLVAIEDGYKPKATPFYEGNPNLKKGNIVFEYTTDEISEIKRCATDIVYFANKYCTVMTDEGLQIVTLRGYQEEMLRQFQNERFSVVLASRQIGKCLLFDSTIKISDGDTVKETTVGRLYFETLSKQRKLTLLERAKLFLWTLYESISLTDSVYERDAILFLITLIERVEYSDIALDQDDHTKKIIDTLELSNTLIHTDTGWQPITHIHKTQPYQVYELALENGMVLEGADLHIIFNERLEQVLIKDVKPGDLIMTIEGPVPVKIVLKKSISVSMFDVTVDSSDHRYWSNGILSHNTICSSIFIAWYVLFNFDRNALILSNKGATTTEILDKGKVILENLPFFLKPGIIKYDVFNSKFDNGCRIIGQTTTKKAAIGFTIHLLFMDEFAHIPAQYLDSFYENVYPTVSASKKSKVIITSTPWGFNKFYEIYTAAEKGLSEFKAFRVDWWDVPGRDEAWMRQEVQNLGSEEAFNRQYGNQFIASSSLLLGPESIMKLQKGQVKYVHRDMPEMDEESLDYSGLLWHPDFDIEDAGESSNYWMFSVDIAEGNGGDASVINIFRISPMAQENFKKIVSPGSMIDFFGLTQVGRFRSNQCSIDDFAKVLYILAYDVFYQENVKLLIEWNTFGAELMKRLETVFPQRNDFDEESVAKFKHRIDARTPSFGLRVKSDNKPILCQNFKKAVVQHRITITDQDTVKESTMFGKLPNGSYSGQSGNDDLIMSSINACAFMDTVDFTEFVEELFDLVDTGVQDEIESILDRDLKGGNLNYDIYDLV